jgi:hypothetical protein
MKNEILLVEESESRSQESEVAGVAVCDCGLAFYKW